MTAMKYRLAEITRGYESGEYSHPTRDHSGLRLTDSESAPVQSGIALYAKRNGELHVLLRLMHNALKAADPDNPLLVQAEEILCDVPNQR